MEGGGVKTPGTGRANERGGVLQVPRMNDMLTWKEVREGVWQRSEGRVWTLRCVRTRIEIKMVDLVKISLYYPSLLLTFTYFSIFYLANLECFLYLYPEQYHEIRIDAPHFKMAFSAHDIITANANELDDDLSVCQLLDDTYRRDQLGSDIFVQTLALPCSNEQFGSMLKPDPNVLSAIPKIPCEFPPAGVHGDRGKGRV